MSAFWDDFASDMENEEFAAEFWASYERYTNSQIGLVPCPAKAQGPGDWEISMHHFATGLGHACPDCKAVV